MIRLLLNILWFILGGFITGLLWWAFGILAFISIIGIPWGRACFTIASLSFWPFGREVANREILSGRKGIGTGALGTIGNIIWILLAGIWLAIAHLLSAICLFLTIIGIPFGLQHVKLAQLAIAPIGKSVTRIH